jgi:hypothetical protein
MSSNIAQIKLLPIGEVDTPKEAQNLSQTQRINTKRPLDGVPFIENQLGPFGKQARLKEIEKMKN